jgi:hypothetical protein
MEVMRELKAPVVPVEHRHPGLLEPTEVARLQRLRPEVLPIREVLLEVIEFLRERVK